MNSEKNDKYFNNDNFQRQTLKNVEEYSDNPLSDNVFFKISKKTEKIATALYMITSLMTDHDPLARRIRENAILLLDDTYRCLETSAGERTNILSQSVITAEQLLSMLAMGLRLGMVSEMNHAILRKEILILQSALYRDIHLNASFDSYKEPHTQAPYHDHLQEFFDEDSSFDQDLLEYRIPARKRAEHQKDINDNLMSDKKNVGKYVAEKTQKTTSLKRQSKPARGEAEKRREAIISILKTKGQVTMKDIATRITNCTEKTLQRDLLSLIKKGVVEKEGEKRWSVYSLVNSK